MPNLEQERTIRIAKTQAVRDSIEAGVKKWVIPFAERIESQSHVQVPDKYPIKLFEA